jgi:hypothetical protein
VSTLTAATWVFSLLLIVAGAAKITRRVGTGGALQVFGGPSDERLARVLGAGEVCLGIAVLATGGRMAIALLALAYAGFAAVAERQRRRGGTCGCFGTTTTPATALHVWFDVAAAGTAAGATVAPGASLTAIALDDPPYGVLILLLVTVVTGVLQLMLTAVPDLNAALALVPPRNDA